MDFKPDLDPSFVADIRDWRPLEHFRPKELSVVWASTDCKEYTRAKTVGVRDTENANRVLFERQEFGDGTEGSV